MSWNQNRWGALRACALLALLLAATPAAVPAAQQAVAQVNDSVLTEYDLEEALDEIMPAGRFHGGFSSEKRMAHRPQALEKLIEKELLYQEALKRNMNVDKALIDKELEAIITRMGGRDNFNAALKQVGFSEKDLKHRIKKKELVKQMNAAIKNRADVSAAEIKSFYQSNQKKYFRPEARKISQILVAVKATAGAEERNARLKRAQEVLAKIKAGQDMAVLAWDYSDDPSRVKGGDMGLIHKGRLDPELEKEAFKLKPGQLSDIIKTIYGYHIVRIEADVPSQQLELDDVADKIRKTLAERKEQQLRQALVDKLRSQARITVY